MGNQCVSDDNKAVFKMVFDRVLKHEGGYVNDSRDRGGETNFGVTIATARANGYTKSMRKMKRSDAFDIYYKAFWLKFRCHELPVGIAFNFFDACVNHGFGNASRILQRALGVADDGIIGNVTMNALAEQDSMSVVFNFHSERIQFYTKLKSFKTFGRGWMRRMADNLTYSLADLRAEAVMKKDGVIHD